MKGRLQGSVPTAFKLPTLHPAKGFESRWELDYTENRTTQNMAHRIENIPLINSACSEQYLVPLAYVNVQIPGNPSMCKPFLLNM